MQKYSASSKLHIVYHQSGGSANPIPTNQAGFVDAIGKLPTYAATHPKSFRIKLQRYDSLPGWPREAQLQWVYGQIEEIATQYGRLATVWADLGSMVKNPDDYTLEYGIGLATLRVKRDEIGGHLKSLARAGQHCIEHAQSACVLDAADKIADYEYRVFLAARHDAFQADTDLKAAQAEVDSLETKLRQMWNPCPRLSPTDPCPLVAVPEPKTTVYINTKHLYEERADHLSHLVGEYPGALHQDLIDVWIRYPSEVRCKANILDPGCLDEAGIDRLAAKINVHRSPEWVSVRRGLEATQ
jgi:hypothetical protein